MLYASPFLHIIVQERREPLGVGRGEKLPYIYYYWSMPLSLFETMGLFQTKTKRCLSDPALDNICKIGILI